jgi:hypothetical protein
VVVVSLISMERSALPRSEWEKAQTIVESYILKVIVERKMFLENQNLKSGRR